MRALMGDAGPATGISSRGRRAEGPPSSATQSRLMRPGNNRKPDPHPTSLFLHLSLPPSLTVTSLSSNCSVHLAQFDSSQRQHSHLVSVLSITLGLCIISLFLLSVSVLAALPEPKDYISQAPPEGAGLFFLRHLTRGKER